MTPPDEILRRVAFHEAGHAWMARREELGVQSVTVDTESAAPGDARGKTVPEMKMEELRPELSRNFARAALAGSLAEHYLIGGWDGEILQARGFDIGEAKSALSLSGQDWSADALEYSIHSMSNEVLDEISQLKNWSEITVIAYALMEKGTLTGEQLQEIMGGD